MKNILYKIEEGKLDRIETYIGVEANDFVCVGGAKGLSEPGVLFSYAVYTRFQRANSAAYLDMFKKHSKPYIIADERTYTIDQYFDLH